MPRGAGVIEYRGKRGLVFRIKYTDAAGEQAMETIGAERDGVTRKQAEAELRERLVRVERKQYRRPKPLTFADWAETWFEEGKVRRAWKPRTAAAYRTVLDHLNAVFGPTRLGSIRRRDVAAYVNQALESFAPRTVNLHLNVLSDVMKTALAQELLDANPVEGVERPRARRNRWRILTPPEVARVAAAFTDAQARTVFLTLIFTGVRRFELRAIRWRDVDLLAGVLRIPESKTEEGERSIALAPTLVRALREHYAATAYKGDGDLVFCHPLIGSRVEPRWFYDAFNEALKTAGINERVRAFHDLRHASLTNGAAAGELPLELMTRAGHRSMETTRQYIDLAGVTFPDAAAALERRLLGGVESSTPPGRPEPIHDELEGLEQAGSGPDHPDVQMPGF